MCDRNRWLAAIRREIEWSHPPWSPVPSHCCKRDHGTGLAPTGYKLMQRTVLHSEKGSALDQLTKRNRNFNAEERINSNAETQLHLRRIGPPASLWLGTRFRRQPLAPSGATLRALGVDRSARPSKGTAMPSMQNCGRVSLLKRKEGRKSVDHDKPLDSWRLI